MEMSFILTRIRNLLGMENAPKPKEANTEKELGGHSRSLISTRITKCEIRGQKVLQIRDEDGRIAQCFWRLTPKQEHAMSTSLYILSNSTAPHRE